MFKWALRYQKTYYLKDADGFELTKQLKHAKLFSTKKDAEVRYLHALGAGDRRCGGWARGYPVVWLGLIKVFLSLGE